MDRASLHEIMKITNKNYDLINSLFLEKTSISSIMESIPSIIDQYRKVNNDLSYLQDINDLYLYHVCTLESAAPLTLSEFLVIMSFISAKKGFKARRNMLN